MRAAYLTRKLRHKIISTRVSARELLGDYDPHLNGGKSLYTRLAQAGAELSFVLPLDRHRGMDEKDVEKHAIPVQRSGMYLKIAVHAWYGAPGR
jgi:hypothetical protein